MSVLLGLAFACLAVIALAAMAVSLKHYTPLVVELRSALREPLPTKELRLTMRKATLTAQSAPDHPRAQPHPKAIKRLLQTRERLTPAVS